MGLFSNIVGLFRSKLACSLVLALQCCLIVLSIATAPIIYCHVCVTLSTPIFDVHIPELETRKTSRTIMDSVKLLEKTKKQLRSVLISEKGGVAADRLERDYRDLVLPD